MRVFFRKGIVGQVSAKRSTCGCAERTGELVVFTCPMCMLAALEHLQALTTRGIEVRLDEEGSVSALEMEREPYGQK